MCTHTHTHTHTHTLPRVTPRCSDGMLKKRAPNLWATTEELLQSVVGEGKGHIIELSGYQHSLLELQQVEYLLYFLQGGTWLCACV